MAKKKLTKNQQEYRKQIYRLRRIELKLMSEGAVLEEVHQLTIPKRVTKKMIENLKDIKPRNIRKKAEIEFNGSFVPYNTYAKAVKSSNRVARILPDENMLAAQIISNIRDSFSTYADKLASWLDEWLTSLVNSFGAVNFARTVQAMPWYITDYFQAYMPDYKQAISEFTADLFSYFGNNEDSLPFLYDIMEETEDWEEY